jgi:molybdate transport system ATP-binding protein
VTLRARIEGTVGRLQLALELEVTDSLVLIGPNGAGKTSALLALLGARPVRRGRVTLGERVILDTAERIDTPIEARRLGYVPQDYALFPHLTVRENVLFGHTARADEGAALLAELELEPLADRRVTALSGGEKQRVALARALVVQPHALLLDEPLAALDVHARREVRTFLARYLRELHIPTLVVTHDPADARTLGMRIAVLEAGSIVQLGTWAELCARPATEFVRQFVGA